MGQTPLSLLWHSRHLGMHPAHLAAEAGLSYPDCHQQSFQTSRPWVTLSRLLFMLMVLVMPSLLMPSPVRFSRRMFQPFWARPFNAAEVEYVFLWFAFFFPSPQSCHSGVFFFCFVLLLRIVLGPMSSQFQWEVVEQEKVLPNIWLRLASLILSKTQFACCVPFPGFSGGMHCSEETGGFYHWPPSPLTCFFCLWAHRLLQCVCLRTWYSNTFSLSKKPWNSSVTPCSCR